MATLTFSAGQLGPHEADPLGEEGVGRPVVRGGVGVDVHHERGCAVWWMRKKMLGFFFRLDHPTSNGGMQNGSSVGICAHCMHVFARLAPDLHAQSVLINKKFSVGAQEEVS